MARPRKIGLDYFSHDVDLSNDEKVEAMENKYGPAGYAFYCKTLERFYRTGKPIGYPGVFRAIMSGKLRITPEDLDGMIAFAVEIELLSLDDQGAILSNGANKRMAYIQEERKFDRDRVFHRKTTGELPENTIKESKVKEIKEDPPSYSPGLFSEVVAAYPRTRELSRGGVEDVHIGEEDKKALAVFIQENPNYPILFAVRRYAKSTKRPKDLRNWLQSPTAVEILQRAMEDAERKEKPQAAQEPPATREEAAEGFEIIRAEAKRLGHQI